MLLLVSFLFLGITYFLDFFKLRYPCCLAGWR
uniref:Uncharacterized protein n=1 Tax=Arundo donax TaxID=35708 RepID=A0A0A9CD97_ARUDO